MLHIVTANEGPVVIVNGTVSAASALSEADREAIADSLAGMIPMIANAA